MNEASGRVTARHTRSPSVLTRKYVTGFQVPLVVSGDVSNPRRVSSIHKHVVSPLGEQLSLLPGSLIHASPKMTLFCGEWKSRLHINWADSAVSGQMLDSFCPSFVSLIEFGACQRVKKRHNLGPRPKQLYYVLFIPGQWRWSHRSLCTCILHLMSCYIWPVLTKLEVWKCSVQSAPSPVTLISSDLMSLHVHFSLPKMKLINRDCKQRPGLRFISSLYPFAPRFNPPVLRPGILFLPAGEPR